MQIVDDQDEDYDQVLQKLKCERQQSRHFVEPNQWLTMLSIKK